jgi:hypothetical protein
LPCTARSRPAEPKVGIEPTAYALPRCGSPGSRVRFSRDRVATHFVLAMEPLRAQPYHWRCCLGQRLAFPERQRPRADAGGTMDIHRPNIYSVRPVPSASPCAPLPGGQSRSHNSSVANHCAWRSLVIKYQGLILALIGTVDPSAGPSRLRRSDPGKPRRSGRTATRAVQTAWEGR